jgi:hypothetical protein
MNAQELVALLALLFCLLSVFTKTHHDYQLYNGGDYALVDD